TEECWPRCLLDRPHDERANCLILCGLTWSSNKMSMDTDEARRRAQTLFKKEQQLREGQQAMAEYQAQLNAMREKTARLRALRLARDAADNKKTRPAKQKGAA